MSLFGLFRRPGHWPLKALLVFFVLAFLGAFYNHLSDLVRGGFFPYERWSDKVPPWLNVYWTLLTFVDLAAVVVLLFRIEAGLWFYLVVITSDVIINFTFDITTFGPWSWVNFMQLCQLGFLVVVLATFRPILSKLKTLG